MLAAYYTSQPTTLHELSLFLNQGPGPGFGTHRKAIVETTQKEYLYDVVYIRTSRAWAVTTSDAPLVRQTVCKSPSLTLF
jgi:hypothetical protein